MTIENQDDSVKQGNSLIQEKLIIYIQKNLQTRSNHYSPIWNFKNWLGI